MTSKSLTFFSVFFLLLVSVFGLVTGLHKGVPLAGDFFFLSHPQNHLVSEMLQKGIFPLWNPYLHCGTPLLSNLREGIFYPLSALFRFFDVAFGYRLILFSHYFLAALFSYLFASRFGFRIGTSIFFATISAFNGFFFLHGAYYNQFTAMVWMPLAFIFTLKGRMSESLRIIILSMVLAFQFFSGNPFFVYATILMIAFYDCFVNLFSGKNGRRTQSLEIFRFWILAVLLFILFTAVQLLPFYEQVKFSNRAGGMSYSDSTVFSETPAQLLKFLTFPLWNWKGYDVQGDPTIVGFYIGVTVIFLTLMFLLRSGRQFSAVSFLASRTKWFWLFCLFSALIFSIGRYLPGYETVWAQFPGMKYFRFPAQWLYLASFSSSILAAGGIESIRRVTIRRGVALLAILELFLFAAKSPFGIVNSDFFRILTPETKLLQSKGPSLRISHTKEGFGLENRYLETAEDWFYAKKSMLPNLSVPFHIASAVGYGVPESRWQDELFSSLSVSPQHLDLWNNISASEVRMFSHSNQKEQLPMQIHPDPLPRARGFTSLRYFTSESGLLSQFQEMHYNPEREILLFADQESIGDLRDERTEPNERVKSVAFPISSDRPHNLKVDVSGLADGGWLYLADSFYPGWKAYVNGSESKIHRANHAFQAVHFPKGSGEVVFVYRPLSFFLGLWFTTLAFAVAATLCFRRVSLL